MLRKWIYPTKISNLALVDIKFVNSVINNIRQNPELNGRCPGCKDFTTMRVEYKTVSAEEYKLMQLKKEKRDREKKTERKGKKEMEMVNKKHLAGLRVVQKI